MCGLKGTKQASYRHPLHLHACLHLFHLSILLLLLLLLLPVMFVPRDRSSLASKRERSNINMPGINEAFTNQMNKRHRSQANQTGRANPDTPQNVITTTAIMLAPPRMMNQGGPTSSMYAPVSTNKLANTPCRGDWAVCAAESREWSDNVVSSGLNTYGNAIPVFTNMGGVSNKTKIRFAGIVGNAGMGKQGDESADNFGQVYSAGTISGMNTGPEYIPPLSAVYLSPYPYIRTDAKTGKDYPGFHNPGWPADCDKYQPATHALRDTDVPAFFHHIESELDEQAAKATTSKSYIEKLVSILTSLGVHDHLPVMMYARAYAPMARVKYVMGKLAALAQGDDPNVLINDAMEAFNDSIVKNARFWQETEKEQKAISNACGGPQWNPRLESLTIATLVRGASYEDLLRLYAKLLTDCMTIWKMCFAEQNNFMRSLLFGRSRYGSPSEGQLDILCGYRV